MALLTPVGSILNQRKSSKSLALTKTKVGSLPTGTTSYTFVETIVKLLIINLLTHTKYAKQNTVLFAIQNETELL